MKIKITKIVSMTGYNEHSDFLHVSIGKTNPAFNRIIKITLPSQNILDKINDQRNLYMIWTLHSVQFI